MQKSSSSSDTFKDILIPLLLPVTALLHLYLAPYTKVEESFNIQAIHDILHHGLPVYNTAQTLETHFDHVTFPGAVPRTFVGALVVAQTSRLFGAWVEGLSGQFIARGVLGLFNVAALLGYQDAVKQAFGTTAGNWFVLLQASQFHVMYYVSRTLPNMFAFGLTTFSLRLFLLSNFGPRTRRTSRTRLALYLLTLAGVIFRSELSILLFTSTAWLLIRPHLHRAKPTPSAAAIISTTISTLRTTIFPAGIAGLLCGLLVTVATDSLFWQRFPIWPEWAAFRFNTLEGHASDWGTEPWHFYFLNAIPRLLLNPLILLLCIPLALTSPSTRPTSIDILNPLLGFITIYSLLPHKESRFILYTVPGLTAVASAGASYIWTRRAKSTLYRVLSLTLLASTIASFAASTAILAVSSTNYPGADALLRLQSRADGERPLVRVHLGNLACQTGVTRFLQKRIGVAVSGNEASPSDDPGVHVQTVWYYDKTSDATQLSLRGFWEKFDYAIVEDPGTAVGHWEVMETVSAYAGVGVGVSGGGGGRSFVEVLLGRWRGGGFGRVADVIVQGEEVAKRWVTGGRWLVVRMEPRLFILKKVE